MLTIHCSLDGHLDGSGELVSAKVWSALLHAPCDLCVHKLFHSDKVKSGLILVWILLHIASKVKHLRPSPATSAGVTGTHNGGITSFFCEVMIEGSLCPMGLCPSHACQSKISLAAFCPHVICVTCCELNWPSAYSMWACICNVAHCQLHALSH